MSRVCDDGPMAGYTAGMKTAVSVPDDVFERADRFVVHRYERFWSDRLSGLEHSEKNESCPAQAAADQSLTLKRRFKAPPAKVFAAFTNRKR